MELSLVLTEKGELRTSGQDLFFSVWDQTTSKLAVLQQEFKSRNMVEFSYTKKGQLRTYCQNSISSVRG